MPQNVSKTQPNGIPDNVKIVQRAMNLFLILFLSIGAVLGGSVAVMYQSNLKTFLSDIKSRQTTSIELQQATIYNEFDHIVSDVLFLARQNELILHLDSGTRSMIPDIEREYARLAESKHIYDQIRFLDENGMETVRVNYSGKAMAVTKDKLQNKGNRYYFKECFALNQQDLFISPLDLNVEGGHVERPLNPMIRIGTPVFDSDGKKRGIVLINYAARKLLGRIVRSGSNSQGSKALLNSDGYWLLGPEKDKEWGFMFKDRANATFARDYPTEWQRILEMGAGQIQTTNGLFTFKTIYPIEEAVQASKNIPADQVTHTATDKPQYFWVLLSHVPAEVMQGYTHTLMFKLFLGGGGLFLLIAFGSWHLAMAISRRKIYQTQLISMALFDSLTGLPNRKNFFDRLTTGIAHAKRYERKLAILFIDLDGFKAVNDTHGHEAGDELLIKVGDTLSNTVRKTDTVARLGGDEFAIILSEIKSVDEAAMVGEKIVKELCRPFPLKAAQVQIGASIGVAVHPDHNDAGTELLKSADQAMYESKSKGKNTCTVATSSDSEGVT
ncbi:bifunctional diguanylate cyclase/phosphodiesterase [Pseudodesulfovibrio sediminis]|uniref:GGDEF domain-containing protein n=1 Tax=Pseudodesulfovibrio sediminis TaxID=2810563 RepID=A0ABM7P9J5_9BACT|nr:diguanylate cyclase [Pseudodesulfovibrio sediminis]BCS89635.1 GGDEF domain-containing protein [Pseudodesulfovibrio sediminis]